MCETIGCNLGFKLNFSVSDTATAAAAAAAAATKMWVCTDCPRYTVCHHCFIEWQASICRPGVHMHNYNIQHVAIAWAYACPTFDLSH